MPCIDLSAQLIPSPVLDQMFYDEQVWVTELSAVWLQPLLYGWVTSSWSTGRGGREGLREQGKLKVNFKILVELPVCSIWKALIVSLGYTWNNLLSSLEVWINLKYLKWIGLKHFFTYHSRYLNSGELVQLPFYLLSLLSSLAISPSHMLQDE